MKFLLDTNSVSYYLRGVAAMVRHIQAQRPTALGISSITAMELIYGMERRQSPTLTTAVEGFLGGITVLPFTGEAARQAGLVRARLERQGITLALADSQIAGHALAADLTLITSDAAFKRISGLTVKDWAKA